MAPALICVPECTFYALAENTRKIIKIGHQNYLSFSCSTQLSMKFQNVEGFVIWHQH